MPQEYWINIYEGHLQGSPWSFRYGAEVASQDRLRRNGLRILYRIHVRLKEAA